MTINLGGREVEIGMKTIKNLEGEEVYIGIYGMEAVFDCCECNIATFTEKSLKRYFKKLIKKIEMEAGPCHFWTTQQNELNAIQFILTSNIIVHCVPNLERLYINIFSCKEFNAYDAKILTQEFFEIKRISSRIILRV